MVMADAASTPSYDNVTTKLLEVLRKYTKSWSDNWTLDTTLAEAEIDSFGFVELVFDVEDQFGIEINFNANMEEMQAMTFGRVLDYVRSGLGAKAVAA